MSNELYVAVPLLHVSLALSQQSGLSTELSTYLRDPGRLDNALVVCKE
jgi:hypothetical protein